MPIVTIEEIKARRRVIEVDTPFGRFALRRLRVGVVLELQAYIGPDGQIRELDKFGRRLLSESVVAPALDDEAHSVMEEDPAAWSETIRLVIEAQGMSAAASKAAEVSAGKTFHEGVDRSEPVSS